MKKRESTGWSVFRALAFALLAVFLTVPVQAFAYGSSGGGGGTSGGGDVGGGSNNMGGRGPGVEPLPGIENMPVWGAPGGRNDPFAQLKNSPRGETAAQRGPSGNSKSPNLLENYIANKLKDKVLDVVLGANPTLLGIVKGADAAYGAYKFGKDAVKKVNQEKKAYQKSAMGMRNSGAIPGHPDGVPSMNPSSPSSGVTGGVGPQRLHDNNFLM